MIEYFLYKFSEVLLKAIIKANRENRKGIQSLTVVLQWVASSQNMPPCSGKQRCLLRHQQLWQTDVSRKKTVFKGTWRDILFSMERYFYGRLEKHCLEIKYVLLSIYPETKWVQDYFIAWETRLCLHSAQVLQVSKYSFQSRHHPGPSPLGMTQQSLFISWFPPHTHSKTSPGQMCIPSLKAEPEHNRAFQSI